LKKGFTNLYSPPLSNRMLSLTIRVIALRTDDGLLNPAAFRKSMGHTLILSTIGSGEADIFFKADTRLFWWTWTVTFCS
ncbi:MAG: hypothetical protein DRH43_05820, partial [Deltaproteobacteria bacterium]